MKAAPWYEGWIPVEFDHCSVEGCKVRHDDEEAEKKRLHDERIRRSERIAVGVEFGVPSATYGELLARQPRFDRSAMLEKAQPSSDVHRDLMKLLALYEENGEQAKAQGDEAGVAEAAEGILATMLLAEDQGLAWFDPGHEEGWRWR